MKRVIACVALSMTALPVGAQTATETDTGSLIPVPRRARIPEGSDKDVDAARIVGADFARCVVSRNPKGVARAIDLPPSLSASKAMTSLATSECLASGEMTISQRVMRGAIFVELYRVYDLKHVAIVPQRPLELTNALAPDFQAGSVRYGLLTFGDCVVKRNRKAARDAVVLATASKAQNAAFKALIPDLGPCLLEGQRIAFSKPIIEGVLAEVLYRGTVAPAAAPESK